MDIVIVFLRSKYFYKNIEKFVDIGIVEKRDSYYIYEGNKIEFKNNAIYLNDKDIKTTAEIHERSYIDYLNKRDFELSKIEKFVSEIDFLIWKDERFFSPLLHKIIIDKK